MPASSFSRLLAHGSAHSQPARFNTTRWSVVLPAGGIASDDARHAFNELIQVYWYPLYAFARRRGCDHHDAMDLTQGFFTQLLSAGGLERVSPESGRFRAFLIASFKNFFLNHLRSAATLRRGGAVQILSLTHADFESRYEREPVDHETPERLYEKKWVETLLARVLRRLADDYERAGKSQLFQVLQSHLALGSGSTSRHEVGVKLGMSQAAVAMSIHRMRRRYGELLREEVASTVNDPADVDDELQSLMAIVSDSG